jgi:hypothetical protein
VLIRHGVLILGLEDVQATANQPTSMIGGIKPEVEVYVEFIIADGLSHDSKLNTVRHAVLDPDLKLRILYDKGRVTAELKVVQIVTEIESGPTEPSDLGIGPHRLCTLLRGLLFAIALIIFIFSIFTLIGYIWLIFVEHFEYLVGKGRYRVMNKDLALEEWGWDQSGQGAH